MHGSFDDTGPRGSQLLQGSPYHLQQHQLNQQQAAALGKVAMAEPMRAGFVQRPYNNYQGIHPNYPNKNVINHNGRYLAQPQQPQQYRRGL